MLMYERLNPSVQVDLRELPSNRQATNMARPDSEVDYNVGLGGCSD